MVSPRVDFYVLPDASALGRELLACRLAEKAYQQGMMVNILTSSPAHSQKLDELLWTFRDGSFVPHEIQRPPAMPRSPVSLGHEPPIRTQGLLINLTQAAPSYYNDFERVVELVDQHPEHISSSRERFRWYRENGTELNTHHL
jgi:DNA polymerase III subunit chi